MNKITIFALVGLAMLSLSSIPIVGLSSPVNVQAQFSQTSQNGNTTVAMANNTSLNTGEVEQQLYTQLESAIAAAYDDDADGILSGLAQIAEGLATINNPGNNITMLTDTSQGGAMGANQTTATMPDNQSALAGGAGNASNISSSAGIDNPVIEDGGPFGLF